MFSSTPGKNKSAESSAKNTNKSRPLYRHWSDERAKAVYEITLRLDPKLAATHCKRGEALAQLGRSEEALAAYDEALTCDSKNAPAHAGRGIMLQALGRLEDALLAFDTALVCDPNDTFAYTRKGLALQALGRLEEALACCNQAVTINSKTAPAHYGKGEILMSLGRPQEALAAYDAALTLDPQIAIIHEGKSKALHALGQHLKALEAFESAYTLDPNIINLTGETTSNRVFIDLLHELQKKLAISEAALKLNPNDASVHHDIGLILMRWGRPQYAVVAFNKAIALCSHNAIFHYDRGQALKSLAQYQDALESFATAVKFNPKYIEAYKEMGIALRALGNRSQEALEVYDKLLTLDPHDANVHCSRGFILRALHRSQEALASFEIALTFNPESFEILYGKGCALIDSGQYQEALTLLDAAIALNPRYEKAYSAKGDVLRILRQPQAALKAFETAIRLNPKYVPAYNGKGVVLRDLGQDKEAIQVFNNALTFDSQCMVTHANRGGALNALAQYQEALEAFDTALSIDVKDAESHNGRGLVLHNLGRFQEALTAYNTALSFGPNIAAIYSNRGVVLNELGEYQEALAAFDKALILNPKSAVTHGRRGLLLHALGRHWEALKAFIMARELKADNNVSTRNNETQVLNASKKDKKSLVTVHSRATLEATKVRIEDVKRDPDEQRRNSLYNIRLNEALKLTGENTKKIEVKQIPATVLSKDIKKYFPQHIDLNGDFLQKVKLRFDAFSLEELERWDGNAMLRLIVHETPAWRRCLSSDREDKISDAEFGSYLKNIAAEIQQRLMAIDNNDKWQTLWKEKALMKNESDVFEKRGAIEAEINLFLSNIKGAGAENRNAMKILYGKWEEFRNKLGSFIARCKRQERLQRKELFVPTKTQEKNAASTPVNREDKIVEEDPVNKGVATKLKQENVLKNKASGMSKPQPAHQKFSFLKKTPALYVPNTEWKDFFSQFLLVYQVLSEEVLKEKDLSEARAEYLFGYMQECALCLKAYVENTEGAAAYIYRSPMKLRNLDEIM